MSDKPILKKGHKAWLKPWGESDNWVKESATFFTDTDESLDFARRPASMGIGDFVFVYAVGWGNFLAVGEVIDEPVEITPSELKKWPHMKRWPWSVEIKSLIPSLGKNWSKNGLKLTELRDEFVAGNPGTGVTIWGSDSLRGLQGGHMQISRDFGQFLLDEIQSTTNVKAVTSKK